MIPAYLRDRGALWADMGMYTYCASYYALRMADIANHLLAWNICKGGKYGFMSRSGRTIKASHSDASGGVQ